MGLRGLVSGTGKYVYKRVKDNRANRRLAKEVEASVAAAVQAGRSPYEANLRDASLQEVLAMLVDGVYYRDHADYDLGLVVKPLIEGEYEVDERMAHFTSSLYWTRMDSISEEEEKEAKVKHYIRHPRNPNQSAPSLVIAIRGTKPSKCVDLVDDIKISMCTLHSSSRFERCRDLVKKIIDEYSPPPVHQDAACDMCRDLQPIVGPRYKSNKQEDYDLCQQCFQWYGASEDYTKIRKPPGSIRPDIYITGHSLGAALALLIGKTLATEDEERCNVHCFNPPFMTISQLMQEGINLHRAKDFLRNSPLEPLMNVASTVKNLAKCAMAMAVGHEKQLVWEMMHFIHLQDWVPVLYINAHDSICKKFRMYYKQKQRMSAGFEVCSQALWSRVLGRRALFSTLVPSVDMRVSKRPYEAHALKNWYRDPAIDKYNQYRLLPGISVGFGFPIHTLIQIIRSEDVELDLAIDEGLDIDSDGETY